MKKEWIIIKVTKKRFTIMENTKTVVREVQVLKLDNVAETSYYSEAGDPTLDGLIIKLDSGREIRTVIPYEKDCVPGESEFYEEVRNNFNRVLDK